MNIDLSYLNYPLPSDINMLYESGRFGEMNRKIEVMCQRELPQGLRKRLEFAKICAEDTLEAFELTREQAYADGKRRIPDLTWEEFDALTEERTLDWHFIEGRRMYRNNCINNLVRTRAEYAAREEGLTVQKEREAEYGMLDGVIRDIREKGSVRVHTEMREKISIESSKLTPGEMLRIWLPLPVAEAPVVDLALLSTSHEPKSIALADAGQRTCYFEVPYEPGLKVTADISWDTEMRYVRPDPAKVTGELPEDEVLPEDLAELEPHVRFAPFLRDLAREIVGEETNPYLKARRIYDFITTKCTYRFMPSYRSIPDIPGYFCANLRGDCGVQALTFITLCRICGIPARWQSGQYTAPKFSGMHDWARFYVHPYGWLFADCSFGGSAYRAGSRERHDFYFGHLDPWRLPLARKFQEAFEPPMTFMRDDPYDNQVGEAETLTRALTGDEIDHSHELLKCTRIG